MDVNSFDQEYVQRLREGDPETQRHFTRYFGELLKVCGHADKPARAELVEAQLAISQH